MPLRMSYLDLEGSPKNAELPLALGDRRMPADGLVLTTKKKTCAKAGRTQRQTP
jgi:hypothetical protein